VFVSNKTKGPKQDSLGSAEVTYAFQADDVIKEELTKVHFERQLS
jgi:hypothetical protein